MSDRFARRLAVVFFGALSALTDVVLGAASSRVQPTEILGRSRQMTLSGRWDAAIAMLKKEIALAADRSDRRSEAALRVELGRVLADRNFFRRTDPAAALEALNDALRFSRENSDPRSEADATQYLGQLHFSNAFTTKDWQTPRGEFLKAIEAREAFGDRRGLAESYFYLGLTYEQDGQPATAMPNYRKSLALSEEVGDLVLQSYAHRHIGGLEEERGELDAAEHDISRSLALRRQGGFTVGVPLALLQMADFVERHRGGPDQAIPLIREAIDAAEKSNSTRGLSAARLDLARHYLKSNRARKALSYAKCARDSALEYGNAEEVKDAETEISEIRQRLGK